MSPLQAGLSTMELVNLLIYTDNNDIMTCGSYTLHISHILKFWTFDLWQIWKIVIIIIYWSRKVLIYAVIDRIFSTFTIYEHLRNMEESAIYWKRLITSCMRIQQCRTITSDMISMLKTLLLRLRGPYTIHHTHPKPKQQRYHVVVCVFSRFLYFLPLLFMDSEFNTFFKHSY